VESRRHGHTVAASPAISPRPPLTWFRPNSG
jgi:hypothetical protein